LENPIDAYSNTPASLEYTLADLSGCNSFASTSQRSDVERTISYSFFELHHVGMKDSDDFVTSVRRTLDVIDNSPLSENAFITGHTFMLWEIFATLDVALIKMFAIYIAVTFVFMLAVLRSVSAAITSVLALAMIVLEVYGFGMTFLKFNTFTVATLLVATGMSIEFVAHLAAKFVLKRGTTKNRIASAMEHTFPALGEGCLAMFFLILPLAFHPITFVVEYMFAAFVLVVIIGIFNGFVFVPLSLVLLDSLFNAFHKTPVVPITDISIVPQPSSKPRSPITQSKVTEISIMPREVD